MYSYNWFIFPDIGQYKCSNGSIRRNRHSSRNDNWRFWSNLEFLKPSSSKTSSKTYGFFRWEERYQEHSKQLVSAIPEWQKKMNFTECEYKFGTIHFQKQLEASNTGPNKVSYVEELRLHLQKGYPEITNLYNKIQTNDEYRSQKIKEIMSARYKSSFEKIISDKIRSSCPKLRSFRELKTRNNKFLLEDQDNVYEDTSIFHMIFTDLFSSVIVGSLDVKDSTELWYRNSENRMIARGTEEDMKKLIELRNELFQEYDLKKIIEEYKMFNASLKYDIEKKQLRDSLTNLYNKIRGGKPLDGSCDLCPPKPS